MDQQNENEALTGKTSTTSLRNYETVEIPRRVAAENKRPQVHLQTQQIPMPNLKMRGKPVSSGASTDRYPVADNLPVPATRAGTEGQDIPRSHMNLPVPSLVRSPSDWDVEGSASVKDLRINPEPKYLGTIIDDKVDDYYRKGSVGSSTYTYEDSDDADEELENVILTFHQESLKENLSSGNLEDAEASLRGILSRLRRANDNDIAATTAKSRYILQLAEIQGMRRKPTDALQTIRTLDPEGLPHELLPALYYASSLYLFAVRETEAAEATCKKAVILARKEVKREHSKENTLVADRCSYLMSKILEFQDQDAEAKAYKSLISKDFQPARLEIMMTSPKPPESEADTLSIEEDEVLTPTAGSDSSPSILSGTGSDEIRHPHHHSGDLSLRRYGLAMNEGMVVASKEAPSLSPISPATKTRFSMPVLTRRASSRRGSSNSLPSRKETESLESNKKLFRAVQKAISTAIQDDDVPAMDVILADPTVAKAKFSLGEAGWTPLHAAAKKGSVEMVRTLLIHGADVTAADRMGNTPLLTALQTPTAAAEALVPLILQHNGNPNHCNGNGDTPMMLASIAGHVKCAAVLREHGARINVKNKLGWTPLHLAARWGGGSEKSTDMVMFLIDHHAQVNLKDMGGRTPLRFLMEEENWAATKRHVSNILKNKGAI